MEVLLKLKSMNLRSKYYVTGIIPESTHHFSRKEDLKAAIERFLKAEREVPLEWLQEHNKLVSEGYISAKAKEVRKSLP